MSSAAARRWSLRVTPMTLCRITLWSFLALVVSTTIADADLWGHLRFGLDMLQSKSLQSIDPYSFTADRPWVNHEWLAELFMGIAYTLAGATGLGLLKLGVIGVIFATLLAVTREESASPLGRDAFIGLTIFVTYSRTQVMRPQLFSVAVFCILLYLLRQADRGRTKALYLVPACFAVWANFHGAWIVGLATLAAWLAGDAWQHRTLRHTVLLAGIGIASVLATLINPYGIGLWQFVSDTVRPARPDITDWNPLLQLPSAVLVVEALLPVAALVAVWAAKINRDRWRISLRDAGVVLLLAVATFRVGRVDAFFQAALAFTFAAPLIAVFSRMEANARRSLLRPSLAVGVFAAALTLYVGWAAIANLRVVHVEGYWIPDRAAAVALRHTRPGARVLTWFNWGEYALWQLSPAGIRVSMDGRRETVYSERVTSDHLRFYSGDLGMIDYPDRIGADHVWLPSDVPMIEPLMRHGWTKVLDTGKSVVLARTGMPIDPQLGHVSGPDVFPWP